MAEIEELIKKVTNVAAVTDQKEKERMLRRELQGGTATSWTKNVVSTPSVQ